jgi:hypothetical protein
MVRSSSLSGYRWYALEEDVPWSHLPKVQSPRYSHQWWRITLHWSDILETCNGNWSWSSGCHSISPSDERSSRNIKQANIEYPSKDSESNGQKLEEQALWAYRTAYKMPIGMMPYQLICRKTCHLPRTWTNLYGPSKSGTWTSRQSEQKEKMQIAEPEEWRETTYYSAKLYKEKNQKMARQANQDQAVQARR